jgi:hypothetical protein
LILIKEETPKILGHVFRLPGTENSEDYNDYSPHKRTCDILKRKSSLHLTPKDIKKYDQTSPKSSGNVEVG